MGLLTMATFADYSPYFLGVGAGIEHRSDMSRAEAIFGQLLHIALWSTVVVYDAMLLNDTFNDDTHAYYHALMLGAAIPLFVAAGAVTLLTFIHVVAAWREWELDFNDGHLPAFATTTILGSIRSSHLFTMLLLLAWITTGTDAANAITNETRNTLIMQLVLKQVGISFTANAHRFAVPGGYVKAE